MFSILSIQYGNVVAAPLQNTLIENTASATWLSSTGEKSFISSNRVQVNVIAAYAIHLTTPGVQEVEAGSKVVWLNRLKNTSNAAATIEIIRQSVSGLSNISIYLDTNQNGEFDSSDKLLEGLITLQPGQQIDLWVIADTSIYLTDKQQLDLPIKATVIEDKTVNASAIDSLIAYQPNLYLSKTVDQSLFEPGAGTSYDLNYTLTLENKSSHPVKPTMVNIDGQQQKTVLVIDPLPANTVFKSVQPANNKAIVLYRTGDNSFTRQMPVDRSQIDDLIVAYPDEIAAYTTEKITLVVEMNNNISNTTLTNRFHVRSGSSLGEKLTQSNDAITQVTGKPVLDSKSGDFKQLMATGSVNSPLNIEASAAVCNASRTRVDQVKIKVRSAKTGDVVYVLATETGVNTGIYRYVLPTEENNNANPNNDNVLQTVKRDSVEITLESCIDATGQQTTSIKDVKTDVLIDPYGIVFDAHTGMPVVGATVILADASGNEIQEIVAHTVDPVTGELKPVSNRQKTDDKGLFIWPYVKSGQYRLMVDTSTISGSTKYTWSSNKNTYPPEQLRQAYHMLVNDQWSYGATFTLAEDAPVLNLDIPVDPILSTPTSSLFVQKVAGHQHVELGDFTDYTVTVANRGEGTAIDVTMKDTLPRGFIYVPGTTRINGVKVQDPVGGKGPYLNLGLGHLDANKEVKVQYRVNIGPNALNGDGINRVYAMDGGGRISNEAAAKVEVRPGVLMQDGFVVGKVYTDCNRNAMQDKGELGIPGVRLYLEDGSFVVTDREGKYDFYGISAKTHVLKIDRTTLLGKGELVLQSNRNAGDPNSRFVDLKHGELHRADFAIADGSGVCSEPLLEQVEQRKDKIENDNVALEQALRTDLSIDPLTFTTGDLRGQPTSGCLNGYGLTGNCNIEYNKEQLQQLKQVYIEPIRKPTLLDLESVLEYTDDNKLTILNLTDGQVLPHDQVTIQIKFVAGANIRLLVNGDEITEKRIGKKTIRSDVQIAGYDYIGIPLKVGKNTILVQQLDAMGNLRDTQQIVVHAPGQLNQFKFESELKQEVAANGVDVYQAVVKVVDSNGTLVASRTPVTLETTIGQIQLKDLVPKQSGIQTFIEGGVLVIPIQASTEPGEGTLRVSSGSFNSLQPIRFLPNLRPMIAAGILEGMVSFRDFDPKQLYKTTGRDGFEEELNEISASSNGKSSTTGRAALFLKGKVLGEYLLTLAYDSDKDQKQRLFRDIRPDEYYPVYGDAAAKGFDAQSTSKLYVRVDKGRSYAMYGDYVTRTESDEGLSLGQYNRSLTGAKGVYESDRVKATTFVAETNARQVSSEQRGLGITGPYSIGNVDTDDVLRNSEKVEVIVRDRNNPGLTISQRTLGRFSDYEIDTFSNSIYLKTPIPSVDVNLNPMYLRITIEVDDGGERYSVAGTSTSIKLNKHIKVGGSYINSNEPNNEEHLASINTVIQLPAKGKLVAEFAHSSKEKQLDHSLSQSKQSGDAMRVDINYPLGNADIRAYHQQADQTFFNTGSPISAGRKESGIKVQARIEPVGLVDIDAIRSEDLSNHTVNQGVSATIRKAINRLLSLEMGLRYYDESAGNQSNALMLKPYHGTTIRTKLTGSLPWEGSNIFAEYEQDISDHDRKVFAVGANYQVADNLRLYGRHELSSTIGGLYELNSNQRRNVTVIGLDSRYAKDASVFSEYRVRDGLSSREAEAAIGLRNRWELEDGVFVNGSFERTSTLKGQDNRGLDSTAITLSYEYLANSAFKAVARQEYRWTNQTDTFQNTVGAAYKLSDDVTLLAKNIFSLTDSKSDSAGDKKADRFQLGMSYRDFEQNKFDALGKFEYRYEDNQSNLSSPYLKHAYIVSTHANYHPFRQMTLSGQYAAKYIDTSYDGIKSHGVVQLVNGRMIYDINERWDMGIHSGLLFGSVSSGKRFLIGAEVGYLVAANLWVSGGYNFMGYRDDEIVDSDTTMHGPYIRLRFKFDEDLFNSGKSRINKSREPDYVPR